MHSATSNFAFLTSSSCASNLRDSEHSAHFVIGDSLDVHSNQSSFAFLTNLDACEAPESIHQTRHLPQGLAKSRTGAKNESDDDFEIPKCWMETEKTKLCRLAAFIKLMFRTPGSVQNKVENDTENELNNSEAKIDADENFNGGDDPENCEAKIGPDKDFEDEGSFGKT